jgi:hypothetical protein
LNSNYQLIDNFSKKYDVVRCYMVENTCYICSAPFYRCTIRKAMSYYKAVFVFGRSIEEKAPEERDIHIKMSTDPVFADPPFPYQDLQDAIDEQQTALDNAQDGARSKIALMRTKEGIVDNMLRKLRDFVTHIANGDTDVILSSGFRHTKPRSSAGDMEKVQGVKNLMSEISGGLKLKWKPVKNVSFYEVNVSLIEQLRSTLNPILPNPDSGASSGIELEHPWITTASKPARIEITGLKPLSQYEVRVRAKGTKDYGGYSDVVIMIIT